MSEQTTPSLLEQLQAHHQAGYLSLHMPGHKENAALAPYLAQLGAEWDITELPGFDDLHAPEGILAKMMDRAAALWAAGRAACWSTAAPAACWPPCAAPPAGATGS